MATPGVDSPPLPGAARAIALPPLQEQRLDNGLGVVAATRRTVPLVSALLMLRAGPEADPPGLAGASSLLATLLTKGARRAGRPVDATAIAQQAEALGGTLDTGSGWRSTTLSITVTTPRLPQALALMADCARQPLLLPAELDRARTQALDALKVSLANPGELASMAQRRQFWGATPYGAIATAASIGRVRPEALVAFHLRHFRPDQAVLVLAGDIDADAAAALARTYFGSWASQPGAAPAPTTAADHPAPQPAAEPAWLVDLPGSGQASVMLALPYPPSATSQRRIAQVANTVLGGGYSARLNQEIRIKRGLSYGAGSDAESHPGGGMVSASAQTDHKNAAAVLAVMREQVASLLAAPVPDDELAARRATLIGSFGRRVESTRGLAALVANQIGLGRPLAELSRFVEDVGAVTAAQVQAFAQAHWAPPGQRAVVVGDLGKAGDALAAAAGGEARRIQAAALDLESAPASNRP